MGKPKEGQVVEVYAKGLYGEGWILAYWGPAKSPSEPNKPYNTKKCWRYCNTEGELNSEVVRWRRLQNVA